MDRSISVPDTLSKLLLTGNAVEVRFSRDDLEHAYSIGDARRDYDAANGFPPRYGATTDPTIARKIDHIGALGEKALSLYTGIEWTGNLGNIEAPDVGSFEVKSTDRLDGSLILHPESPDGSAFVLALVVLPRRKDNEIVSLPTVYLAGWTFAREAKRPEFWWEREGGRSAYFVPMTGLNSMNLLRD